MKGLKKHIKMAIAITAVFAACVLTLGFNTQPQPPPSHNPEKAAALESFPMALYEAITASETPAEVPKSQPVPEASSALPAPSAPTATPQVPATNPEVAPARPPVRPDPVVEVINPPTNLQGEFLPGNRPRVRLTWDRNNPRGTVRYYLVYRVVEGEEPDPDSLEPIGRTRRTRYTDWVIEPGLTYRYWVTAVSRQGEESEPSEPVVVETFTDQVPAPPQGVEAVAIDPGVSMDWQPNTEPNLAGYHVYRQRGGGRWRRLTSNPISDNHYYFDRGRVGQVYAVSAVNVYGTESEKSVREAGPSTPVIYEESDPSIVTEGLWVIEKYEGPTNGQILVAGDAGARLHFHFTGRQVKMIVARYWSCGSANVYLDGELAATVNMYSPDTTYMVVEFDKPGIKHGAHVLTLEVLGTGNPEVDHNFVNIDAFEVR